MNKYKINEIKNYVTKIKHEVFRILFFKEAYTVLVCLL
jgi:hypothetical protein